MDCKDCKVALVGNGFQGRCGPCAKVKALATQDPKKIARFILKSKWVFDGCYAGCGEMGACHPNLGAEAQIMARAILGDKPLMHLKECDGPNGCVKACPFHPGFIEGDVSRGDRP